MKIKRLMVFAGLASMMPSCFAGTELALQTCARVANNEARLACYDKLAQADKAFLPSVVSSEHLFAPASNQALSNANETAVPVLASQPAPAQATNQLTAAQIQQEVKDADIKPEEFQTYSALSRSWDLEQNDKRGTFVMRPYRPNYMLPVWYQHRMNDNPHSPTLGSFSFFDDDLNRVEAKFQISFKTKVIQDVLGSPADVWFAYSQQSHWQMYNKKQSSPFRETDYEPEVFMTIPTPDNWRLGDLRLRMLGFGALHQSNGRADPESRSWNRIYGLAAFEYGNLVLQARMWHRLRENPNDDNNPDITKYMGYGDLQAIYHKRHHTFAALIRANTSTGKGAAKLDWTFPISGRLKGYVQVFNGYGESIIDYNYYSRGIGFGLTLTDWLAY